jgi:uncharacterized protein (TIGR03435 family)
VFRRRFAVLTVVIGAGVVAAPFADGQSHEITPKFEVASIRHCAAGGRGGVFGPPAPGRIAVNCSTVMSLIRQSYILFANGRMNLLAVKVVPMEKSPPWIDSDLYTIEAKAESNPGQATPGQGMMLGPMMQALLEDRFKVRVHREVRQVSVYELSLGKGVPSLHKATESGCVAQDLDQPLPPPSPGQAARIFCGIALGFYNGFDLRSTTMEQLCTALSGRVDRRVIDKTGLSGTFDIHLDWSNGEQPSGLAPPPGLSPPGAPPAPGPDPGEVTANIQTALQKLGLKFVPALGPGDFLVIDYVERSSEN